MKTFRKGEIKTSSKKKQVEQGSLNISCSTCFDFESVKNNVDLLSYIEKTHKTKKVGENTYRVIPCPLCDSKKGLNIDVGKNLFNCFACDFRGSVVDWEMGVAKCTSLEALKSIAENENIELSSKPDNSSKPNKQSKPNNSKQLPDKKEKNIYSFIWNISQKLDYDLVFGYFVNRRGFSPKLAKRVSNHILEACRYNEYKQKRNIVIPIRDIENNKLVGIQTIDMLTSEKRIQGTSKGIYFLSAGRKEIFIVESISNAYALYANNFSVICIFSANNTDLISEIIKKYPDNNIVLWLDKGIEKRSHKALKENNTLKAILFEKQVKGYDINDLLRDTPENFTDSAQSYINKAISFVPGSIKQEFLENYEEIHNHNLNYDLKSSIDFFIHNEKQAKLFLAPTGAGKTFFSAENFLTLTRQGKRVLYVASNRTDQKSFCNVLQNSKGTLEELNVFSLNMESNKEGMFEGKANKYAGFVTNRAYMLRKGHSTLFYAFWKWIIKNAPITFIDEVEDFCNACKVTIQINGRYSQYSYKNSHTIRHKLQDKCPRSSHSGNCNNCKITSHLTYNPDNFNIMRLKQRGVITDKKEITSFYKHENEVTLQYQIGGVEYLLNNLVVRKLKQEKKTDLEPCFFLAKDNFHDAQVSFVHMINFAHEPRELEYTPTLDKKAITQAEILQLEEMALNDSDKESQKEIKAKLARIKYPSFTGVKNIILKDSAPIILLKKYCKKIVLLGADISSSNLGFLQNTIKTQVEKTEVSKNQIDNLLIVSCKFNIDFLKYTSMLKKIDGKILIFERVAKEAKSLFDKLRKNNYPCSSFYKDIEVPTYTFPKEASQTLITYSLGNLGKAIRLLDYCITFANARNYKPAICFDFKKMQAKEIMEYQERDRISTIFQNGGRFLGGNEGTKILVLYNAEKELLKILKEKYKGLVKNEIKTTCFQSESNALFSCISEYFNSDGNVINREQEFLKIKKKKLTRKAEKGLRRLSKKQRNNLTQDDKKEIEEKKENKAKTKKEAKGKEKIEKIRKLLVGGLTEPEINRRFHLDRLNKKEFKKFWLAVYTDKK